jgi:glycosyltransferase involved in cell wall biosynthesis
MAAKKPLASIVIPFYNEEDNLPKLIDELEAAMGSIDYEAIFIDDGSTDSSFEILKKSRKKNRRIKIIQFSDNFGQQAGFTAGYQAAKGKIIVTMDADLQNDPADIPGFLDKIEKEDYHAVFGWRVNRENSFLLRRLPSKFFNWIRNRNLRVPLHDYGCALNAFRREFIDELAESPEYLKHITTYIAGRKRPYVEVKINERERTAGKSHYNFPRLVQLGIDLLITTSTKPVATYLLIVMAALSFVLFAVSAAAVTITVSTGGDCSILCMVYPFVFLTGSLVCAVLALINEKVSALLRQMHKKPLYIIKEQLD